MVTLMEFTAHRRRPKGQAPQGRCMMHTRELCVTIRLDHDPSGVRAEAIFRGDDRESVTGIGQVVHHRTNPFPAREDLALVRALHDLADRREPPRTARDTFSLLPAQAPEERSKPLPDRTFFPQVPWLYRSTSGRRTDR